LSRDRDLYRNRWFYSFLAQAGRKIKYADKVSAGAGRKEKSNMRIRYLPAQAGREIKYADKVSAGAGRM